MTVNALSATQADRTFFIGVGADIPPQMAALSNAKSIQREETKVLVALLERAGMSFGPSLSPASLEAGYNGAVSSLRVERATFSAEARVITPEVRFPFGLALNSQSSTLN